MTTALRRYDTRLTGKEKGEGEEANEITPWN
jgi:hypothetical protein